MTTTTLLSESTNNSNNNKTNNNNNTNNTNNTMNNNNTNNNSNPEYDILINILMLGDEEVGKGSVARRYTEGYFPINENLYNIEVDRKHKDIKDWGDGLIKRKDPNKPVIGRLQLWNFHMHKISDIPTKQQYRETNGFILFFDVTNKSSFLQLSSLIELVRAKCADENNNFNCQSHSRNSTNYNRHSVGNHCPSSPQKGEKENNTPPPPPLPPIVIVGNKCDDVSNTVVDPIAAKKYCDSLSIPLLFISAKTNENVDEAFNILQGLIIKQMKIKERERQKLLKQKHIKKDVNCNLM
ncbi:hypothetical protein ACTFIU_003429 [Dictyostelium citrinum]